ncbi:uncharacterized protein LOC135113545 isoform X2 [Scylla paramamosain]|uniref:uncharacterized protein LOC135113545 isoform X2 n=1 Tax=Scylla paramamosain TaxID=85552 RepID=UPI0030827044
MIILKEHVQARQSLHRSRKAFVSPHRPIQTREGLGPPRRSRGVCFTGDADYDHDEVLRKSLRFYEAQRSGFLPNSQRVTWRRDSATDDAIDPDTNDDVEEIYFNEIVITGLTQDTVEDAEVYKAAGGLSLSLSLSRTCTSRLRSTHASRVFKCSILVRHSYLSLPRAQNEETLSFPAVDRSRARQRGQPFISFCLDSVGVTLNPALAHSSSVLDWMRLLLWLPIPHLPQLFPRTRCKQTSGRLDKTNLSVLLARLAIQPPGMKVQQPGLRGLRRLAIQQRIVRCEPVLKTQEGNNLCWN